MKAHRPMRATKPRSWFARFARATSRVAGSPAAFIVASSVVISGAVTGPLFAFDDSWQLIINTGTTIATFLMVFLIQNTQYRDAEAVQVKLDELLRVTEGAHNVLMNLEELEESELDRIRDDYVHIAERARNDLRHGMKDTDVPDVPRHKRGA